MVQLVVLYRRVPVSEWRVSKNMGFSAVFSLLQIDSFDATDHNQTTTLKTYQQESMLTQFRLMQTKKMLGFLLMILFSFSMIAIAETEASPDYYSPDNVLKFADYLYDQGDFIRAAAEYQRFLFYKPAEKEQIRFKVALCYRLGGKPQWAIHTLETFLDENPKSGLSSRAYYEIGVSYFLLKQYEESKGYLETSLPRISDMRVKAESQQLIGLSYLMQKQWSKAEKIFNVLESSDVTEVNEKAIVYSKYAKQGKQLPIRNPFLAGLFSAVIPGSGRFYTGRIGDALTSIFIVSLTSWQAYDGFRRDGISSVKGWTLGTLSGIFYLGNIYGSVISAKVYNRHISDEHLMTLHIRFPY